MGTVNADSVEILSPISPLVFAMDGPSDERDS